MKTLDYQPSKYQWNIFNFVLSSAKHGVVEAVAGSGKTTTLETAAKMLPRQNMNMAFVAFNRHIAQELEARLPVHVHVSTLHSLGFSGIRHEYGRVDVNPKKLNTILDQYNVNGKRYAVKQLVSLCKATLLKPTEHNLDYITGRWGLDIGGDEQGALFTIAQNVYAESLEQTRVIDYDDMIFFPASGRAPTKQFDLLFVDEAQDLNAAQLELAFRSIKPGGRIIAVGDRWQSIYGFRGADVRAIPHIIERLDAETLPLSITYRCPKLHVALARDLVPSIEWAPNAIEGNIQDIRFDEMLNRVKSGDLVLCRTNAPLVPAALTLIRAGKKAVILGRDIGRGLMQLLKRMRYHSGTDRLFDLLYELECYKKQEAGKFIRQEKFTRAQSLRDRVETIFALSEGCETLQDVQRRVHQVFDDTQKGVTFSTVHKAKGTEAERVFILEPGQMPHPMASRPWEVQQEKNIKYVALTRSKRELFFVR
jgi:DNA helicase-2/ATP-dependent DNA helicase PcrA